MVNSNSNNNNDNNTSTRNSLDNNLERTKKYLEKIIQEDTKISPNEKNAIFRNDMPVVNKLVNRNKNIPNLRLSYKDKTSPLHLSLSRIKRRRSSPGNLSPLSSPSCK